MDAIEDSGISDVVLVFALVKAFPNVEVVEAFHSVGISPYPSVVAEVGGDEIVFIVVWVCEFWSGFKVWREGMDDFTLDFFDELVGSFDAVHVG